MKNVQTFAGYVLQKQDFNKLSADVFNSVLQETITQNNGKNFVTPEQYVMKFKARFGQINACLDKLVRKGILKRPVQKQLDNGRMQNYYYFNMSSHEAYDYIQKLLTNAKSNA